MSDVSHFSAPELAYRAWLEERGLPPSAIRYAEAIVSAQNVKAKVSPTPTSALKTFAPIAVCADGFDTFTQDEVALFGKILQAAGQSMESSLILSDNTSSLTETLAQADGPKLLVFFGSHAADKFLTAEGGEPLVRGRISNDRRMGHLPVLVTLSVKGLQSSQDAKRVVWCDLKLALEFVKGLN